MRHLADSAMLAFSLVFLIIIIHARITQGLTGPGMGLMTAFSAIVLFRSADLCWTSFLETITKKTNEVD